MFVSEREYVLYNIHDKYNEMQAHCEKEKNNELCTEINWNKNLCKVFRLPYARGFAAKWGGWWVSFGFAEQR